MSKPISSCASAIIALVAIAISMFAAFSVMGMKGGAAPSGGAKIAFVNFSTVIRETEAGKAINKQAGEKVQALRNEAQEKVKELQKHQEELKENATIMQPKELADKQAALQKQIDSWNVTAQKREAAINAAVNKAVQSINETLRADLANVAQANNFTAILPAEQTFYMQKALDLTSDAIRIINEKIPAVELTFEEEK